MTGLIVYFSSASRNTERFVEHCDFPARGIDVARIPLGANDAPLHVATPYILIVPTYGGGDARKAVPVQVKRFLNDPGNRSWIRGVIASGNTNFGPYILIVPTYGGGDARKAVPVQVKRFLNDPGNRSWIRGVIASGNTNFGEAYAAAGPIIARKCGIPLMYRFELMGTARDIATVTEGVTCFFADEPTDTTNIRSSNTNNPTQPTSNPIQSQDQR